ncbi:MAG: hypothetical protein, partial [Olavius algarvensis Gamma 1 endosymbiont]
LRPLRHFGQPLAPTPTADYPPRASRFPGGQRAVGLGRGRLGKGPEMARAQQFQLRGQCRVVVGGGCGGNHCGQGRQNGPGGRCGQRV